MLAGPSLLRQAGTECDKTLEPGVLSLVDHTHSAAAQLFDDVVMGGFLVDHEWRRNLLRAML